MSSETDPAFLKIEKERFIDENTSDVRSFAALTIAETRRNAVFLL